MKTIVVGAWSPYHGQTGNTSNCIALATRLAFMNSLATLLMHGSVEKSGMERAFFAATEQMGLAGLNSNLLMETGVDAVLKLMRTGQIQEGCLKDYAAILIRNRLELLPGMKATDDKAGKALAENLAGIIDLARGQYDMVFLDIAAGKSTLSRSAIEASDLLLVSLNQNREVLSSYFEQKDWLEPMNRKPHLIVVGQYDPASRWTITQIRKTFGYHGEIYAVPRNAAWMDAHNDHEVLEFFQRMTTSKRNASRNAAALVETLQRSTGGSGMGMARPESSFADGREIRPGWQPEERTIGSGGVAESGIRYLHGASAVGASASGTPIAEASDAVFGISHARELPASGTGSADARPMAGQLMQEATTSAASSARHRLERNAPVRSASDREWLDSLDRILSRILHMASLDDMHSFNPIERRTLMDRLLRLR